MGEAAAESWEGTLPLRTQPLTRPPTPRERKELDLQVL